MGKSKGKQCLRNQQKRSEPSQVCFAELISPNEVEVGLQGYEGQDKEFLRGKWLLNGSVSKHFFGLLERTSPSKIKGHLGYVTMKSGAHYGMIFSQIGSAQHRFMLPLYSKKVREFFACPSIETVNIFYGNGSDQGFGLNYEVNSTDDDIGAVSRRMQSIDLERMEDFVAGFDDAVQLLGRPSYGDSLVDGVSVLTVDMSVLVPLAEIGYTLGFPNIAVAA